MELSKSKFWSNLTFTLITLGEAWIHHFPQLRVKQHERIGSLALEKENSEFKSMANETRCHSISFPKKPYQFSDDKEKEPVEDHDCLCLEVRKTALNSKVAMRKHLHYLSKEFRAVYRWYRKLWITTIAYLLKWEWELLIQNCEWKVRWSNG